MRDELLSEELYSDESYSVEIATKKLIKKVEGLICFDSFEEIFSDLEKLYLDSEVPLAPIEREEVLNNVKRHFESQNGKSPISFMMHEVKDWISALFYKEHPYRDEVLHTKERIETTINKIRKKVLSEYPELINELLEGIEEIKTGMWLEALNYNDKKLEKWNRLLFIEDPSMYMRSVPDTEINFELNALQRSIFNDILFRTFDVDND